MTPCLRLEIATRGGGELRSVSSRGALWDPRIFLMLNEIEGLNGSTAAYVPGVGWNSIEGCYRSSSSFKLQVLTRFEKLLLGLWQCQHVE